MAERLLGLLLFIVICTSGWILLRAWLHWRFVRIAAASAQESSDQPGVTAPALLYFTTEDCAQCRFQQSPILQRLAEVTTVPIVKIDALADREIAHKYGILTVPSTVVLNAERVPVAINHGVAHLEKLRMQVSALG